MGYFYLVYRDDEKYFIYLPRESPGVPIIIDDYPYFCDSDKDKAKQSQNEAKWNEIIDSMIQLLDEMDENSSVYENISPVDYQLQDKQMTEAKDKFFALFSKYFYCLWD